MGLLVISDVQLTLILTLTSVLVRCVFKSTFFLHLQKQKDVFETVCRIPMITSAKEEQKIMASCKKVNNFLSQLNDKGVIYYVWSVYTVFKNLVPLYTTAL